ncbi:50S ribosomal protein L24 [Patescibacteria group bacterium]
MRIKTGDKVLVTKGKDRGKTGKVLRVLKDSERVVIENVSLMKKAVRPNRKNQKGGLIEFPSPIAVSNVQIICPRCNKKTRISVRLPEKKSGDKKDRRERICKKCKGVIS